jgi:hypothetical protein
MTLARVLLAWMLALGFFTVWLAIERFMRKVPGSLGQPLRASLPFLAVEAGLLALLGGLWFASLGSGGAVLLFLLVGALMEVPSRLRSQQLGDLPWKPVIGGLLRIVIAGLLLRLVMG